MKTQMREIFVKHGSGYKVYPFAFGEVFNSAGVSLGSGFVPNGDAIYNSPLKDEVDIPMILPNALYDPDFLNGPALATGIRNGNNW